MNRAVAGAAAVAVVASVTTGVIMWQLSRHPAPPHPQISAYSHGHLTRVGPYRYCEVLDLNACELTSAQGELPVTARNSVQLSVPAEIGRAPWRLLTVYENPDDPLATVFRPNTRLAVTIPTVDQRRGRLTGFAVQLLTLVIDPAGELRDVPHAEWSVRTVWR